MQTITGIINKALEYKAITQEKEATPTKEIQKITPDEGYDGISKMTIKKIPDEYIIPTGSIEITSNGTYDVTDKASAIVKVAEKKLGTKSISQTGVKTVTYNASDDDLDGYSKVDVTTSGVDINEYISNIPEYNYDRTCGSWIFLVKKLPPLLIGEMDIKNLFAYFMGTEIPDIDISNATSMYSTFKGCYLLVKIPQLNAEKVQIITSDTFYFCTSLTTFGGLLNIGQAFSTTNPENASANKIDLHYSDQLTHDSLMNVINGLYDIATKGCNAQSLYISSTNIAKLTSEEIAIATNKGWTVS